MANDKTKSDGETGVWSLARSCCSSPGFRFFKDKTFHILGTDYSGFILMTAVFVVLIIATTALLWKLTGTLSKMQMMTLILVIVMGGLSVWLKDERFIKMKPTLLYLAFGITLGIGLLRGESYLKLVMEEALPLHPEGWMILTRRLTAFFFGLAIANEVVWRTAVDRCLGEFQNLRPDRSAIPVLHQPKRRAKPLCDRAGHAV